MTRVEAGIEGEEGEEGKRSAKGRGRMGKWEIREHVNSNCTLFIYYCEKSLL